MELPSTFEAVPERYVHACAVGILPYFTDRFVSDNGARKKAHRRVGSDQSLASCESFPTGVSGPPAISRSASFSVQDYEKKITHLSEMLEARERKMLDIAKENAQLADENEQLRK